MTHMTRHAQQNGFILIPVVIAIVIVATIAFMLNNQSAINTNTLGSENQGQQVRYVTEAGFNHALWLTNNSNCTAYPSSLNNNFGLHSYKANVNPAAGSPVTITATGTLQNGISRNLSHDGIRIYQPALTTTLQPGAEGKDSFIEGNSGDQDKNKGDDNDLITNSETSKEVRSLLHFDLSDISSTVRIISATLELNLDSVSGDADVVRVHRLSRNWTENGVTWLTYDGANNWTKPGGDFDAEVAASFVADTEGWKTLDISTLAQTWVSGLQPNFGLLLLSPSMSGNNEKKYISSDDSDAALHPKLTITYACECGQACTIAVPPTCDADYIVNTKVSEFNTAVYGSDVQKDLDYIPENVALFGVTTPAGGAWLSVDATDARFYLNDINGVLLASSPGSSGMGGVAYVSSGAWVGHIAVTDFNSNELYYYDKNGVIVGLLSLDFTDLPSGITFIAQTTSGIYDAHFAVTDRNDNKVYIVDQEGILTTELDIKDYASGPTDVAHIPGSDKLLVLDETQKAYIIVLDGTRTGEYDTSSFGTSGTAGLAINSLTCDHVIGDDGVDKVIALNKSTLPFCDAHYTPDTKVKEFSTSDFGEDKIHGITYFPEGLFFDDELSPVGGAWINVDPDDDEFYMTDMDGNLLTKTGTPGDRVTGISFIQSGDWDDHLVVVDDNPSTLYYVDLTGLVAGSFSPSAFGATTPTGVAYIGTTVSGTYDGMLAITNQSNETVYITDQSGSLQTTIQAMPSPGGKLVDVAHLPGTDKLLLTYSKCTGVFIDLSGTYLGEYELCGFGIKKAEAIAINPLTCDHVAADRKIKKVVTFNEGGGGGGGGPPPPPPLTGVVFEEFTETKLGSNGTSMNVSKPGGTAAGDLLIAAIVTDGKQGDAGIQPPAGWNLINHGMQKEKVTLGVWWKLAGSSEPANYTFTWPEDEEAYGTVMHFSGNDPVNPINITSNAGGKSFSPISPAVITTVPDAMILRIGGFNVNNINVGNPGLSGHSAIDMDSSSSSKNSASSGSGYKLQSTAGSSGSSTFTLTKNKEYRAVTIGIAPAP